MVGSADPVWDAELPFNAESAGGELQVEVYDWQPSTAHDFLGQVVLHSPCSKCRLPANTMALITSVPGPGGAIPPAARQQRR